MINGLVGFCAALFGGAGILLQRLEGGDRAAAIALDLGALTLTVLVAWTIWRAPRKASRGAIALGHALGAVLGIGALHAAIAAFAPDGSGLHEAPRQLVNDAVLVAGGLLLAWSIAARSGSARMLTGLAAFALIGGYHATAGLWHVDAIAFPTLTVQSFVAAQVLAIAAGLLCVNAFVGARSR